MSSPQISAHPPVYEDYARCVHCGICLNTCPTYRLWNVEADSPARPHPSDDPGRTPGASVSDSFVEHIDKCLDCRSCETACPSGVEYGRLVEHARAHIETDYQRPFFAHLARNFSFRHLLPYPATYRPWLVMLRFYQRSGLQSVARSTGILKLYGLADREMLLPAIDDSFFFSQLGSTFPAAGQRRARVAFFAGCVAQVTFAKLNEATVRVLTANGCDVVVPATQFCCGALAAHAGVRDAARDLARKNLDAFLSDDFDAIITNAAGCGSTLKEYERFFSSNEPDYTRAQAFRAKVRDVTEFLADLGLSAPCNRFRFASLTRIPATCFMDRKFATPRASCCIPFLVSTLWNCPTPNSAAAPPAFTT